METKPSDVKPPDVKIKRITVYRKPGTPFSSACIRLLEILSIQGYALSTDEETAEEIAHVWDGQITVFEHDTLPTLWIPLEIKIYILSDTTHFDLIYDTDFNWFSSILKGETAPDKRHAVLLGSRNKKVIALNQTQHEVDCMQKGLIKPSLSPSEELALV